MFSLTPYYHSVLCSIYRAFGVTDGNGHCIRSYRAMTEEQRQATEFFENLITSPTAPLSYQVAEKNADGRPTGRVQTVTTTVARLMGLASDYDATRQRLQEVLNRAFADGYAQFAPLSANEQQVMLRGPAGFPFVTRQTRDPMLANPTDSLRFPIVNGAQRASDPYYPTDPRMVPQWWPKPTPKRNVWFNPRVLDRSLVATDRLRQTFESLVLAIAAYLKSRNVPLGWHPLTVVCRGPMFRDEYAYNMWDNGMEAYIQQFRDERGNDRRFLLSTTVLGTTIPEDINSVAFFPTYHANWLRSLDVRLPLSWNTDTVYLSTGSLDDHDSNVRTWITYTADPLLELLRWMNMAQFLLDSGNTTVNESTKQDARATMVDIFASQAIYTRIQDAAYRLVGLQRGDIVIGYQEKLAKEAAARENRKRSLAIQAAGVEGYESAGDDAADIATATIGTVGLAFADAVKTGNIAAGVVSLLVRGLSSLIAFLSAPSAPRSPYTLPIRLGGSDPKHGLPVYGLSPKFALESPPCYRLV